MTGVQTCALPIYTGTLEEQKAYIESMKMPASACIFSGNKSLHYAIVLDEPLPSLEIWRFYNQWILNVMSKSDQQIQNPTRSIRFPGNKRHDGKKLIQAPLFIGNRISQEELFKWLDQFNELKPVKKAPRIMGANIQSGVWIVANLPRDVQDHLNRGVTESRNATWFYIACRCAEKGWSMEYAEAELSNYFQEEGSFPRREWLNCLKSAYKRVQGE